MASAGIAVIRIEMVHAMATGGGRNAPKTASKSAVDYSSMPSIVIRHSC
jgi:hypothetical protein